MTVKLYTSRFYSALDVGACIFKENVPKETFNISFESTQNKQHYGTQITCTDVHKWRGEGEVGKEEEELQ